MLMQKRPVISVIPGKSKGLPVRHTYQRRALATSVKLVEVEQIGTRPAVRTSGGDWRRDDGRYPCNPTTTSRADQAQEAPAQLMRERKRDWRGGVVGLCGFRCLLPAHVFSPLPFVSSGGFRPAAITIVAPATDKSRKSATILSGRKQRDRTMAPEPPAQRGIGDKTPGRGELLSNKCQDGPLGHVV
jgi:hypothetical protein